MTKKYRVAIMARAMRDIDGIYTYISQTLQSPDAASGIVDALEHAILSLDEMPYRCAERKRGAYANKGYRQMFVENYIVIYRVSEQEKTVIIVTVKYSRNQF